MMPVRLDPAAPRSPVEHSTTELLRSLIDNLRKGFTSFRIAETRKHIKDPAEMMKRACKMNHSIISAASNKIKEINMMQRFSA